MTGRLSPALVIAIDGPSGSGKSSTSREVAKRLGCAYLDTGSMYRALAVWCRDHDIPASDEPLVTQTAVDFPLQVTPDPADFRVLLDGKDVTTDLHTPAVSGMVSAFAKIRSARNALNEQMRRIMAEQGRIVVEGRDITTVVAPDAQLRVLLQADPEQRIARREQQLAGAADRETVAAQVVGRDKIDAISSEFAKPAEGVVLIDSTFLTLEEVVAQIVALAEAVDEPVTA